MKRPETVRAHDLQPGDEIAHPWSGTKYTIRDVERDSGKIRILYVPSRGTIGVTVSENCVVTRWKEIER